MLNHCKYTDRGNLRNEDFKFFGMSFESMCLISMSKHLPIHNSICKCFQFSLLSLCNWQRKIKAFKYEEVSRGKEAMLR